MARRTGIKNLGIKSLQTSGFILGLAFSVILSAEGKQCYECNNDDENCFPFERHGPGFWSIYDIPSHYIKDCDPRSIGCIQFEAFFEFTLGDFYHRSCLYETDKICFDKDGNIGRPKSYRPVSPWNHTELLSCLKKSRSNAGLPEFRMPKREIPKVKALAFKLEYGYEDLTNNKERPSRDGLSKDDKEKAKIPETTNAKCYSCENEMSEYGFENWRKDHLDNTPVEPLPHCSEGTATKSIQCNGAYGCVAFWEVREEANRRVSRVWRDCWYPGEMKCLRNPNGVTTALRTLKDSDDEESCKAKYFHRSGCTGCITTVWQGILNIESLQEYGAYLECVKDIREKEGKEFNWSIKEVKDFKNPPANDGPFARIRFYYCASSIFISNCNKGKEAPNKPTTTTSATTSKTPTPVTTSAPSVIVNPTGGGGSGGGTGGEFWQGCEDEAGTGIGSLLRSDTYLALGLIFCSVSIL